jgi:hypothetical protein
MVSRSALALAFLVTSALACGEDGTALEGIYHVQTWTNNDTSCDSEGVSIIFDQGETIFYVKHENFIGEKFLNVNFCADLAECEADASEADTIHVGTYILDGGNDDSGWTSTWYSGSAQDNVCSGSLVETRLTGTAGTAVRIETRLTAAGGFAPDGDGFCDDDDGEDAAQGLPCGDFTVIAANWLADLP